jgi:hypothetical protein
LIPELVHLGRELLTENRLSKIKQECYIGLAKKVEKGKKKID